MKHKNLYMRLFAALVVFLIVGGSFRSQILTVEDAAAKKELESSQAFSLPSEIHRTSGLAQAPFSYSGYTRITDNEEKINVQVPVEWLDIETGAWKYKNKQAGVFLAASGNLADFYSNPAEPGVFIGVSRSLAQSYDMLGLLGLEKKDVPKKCIYKGRFEYKNQFHAGQYDHFTNCAAGNPGLLIFTTASPDKRSLILIRIVVASEADLEAVDTIINSFQVLGNPEQDEHHSE